MPSIFIGNSTISGNAFSLTGPTGNTGPRGITGNVGLIGITGGPTGSTGIYVKNIVKTDAGFLFSLFGGTTIGPISGFTGPNILYYSSKGISAAFGADYSSVFLHVTGGMTFAFRGICGGNEYVTTSMSSDGTEVLVTVQNLPSGSVLYGISTDNFLAYTNSSYTATKTKIKIENQTTEDDTSSFKSSTNFGTLNFGLTANAVSNKINDVETYLDSTHPFLPISSLNRSFNPVSVLKTNGIRSIDSGGYVLDMNKASVFKISTPVGITSFYVDTNTPQKLKTWLFFIEGSDVWNFPQNVYFENGITGIQNYAFSPGMNILRIESDPINNNSFYASFVDRFFGDSGVGIKYGGIGSCCKTDGTCEDYTTQSVCTDVYRGVFTPLASCANTCDVGSCCINGTCYDTVQRSVCAAAGGVFGSSSCSVRGPCNLVYTVETVDPPELSTVIEYSNSASVANPQTIATFNVKTNQANSKVEIPNAINDSLGALEGEFFIKDHLGLRDDLGVYTISTPNLNPGLTFTVQFNNSQGAMVPGTVYQPTNFTVKLKDSSGVEKSSLTYKLKPSVIDTCAGVPNSVLIKTHYFANRYCRDCYNMLSSSRRTYYPVQKQNGSFDFCVNLTKNEEGKYVTTPVCTVTSDVEHVNDCKITALNEYTTTNPPIAEQCPHIDHQFNSTNCDGPCSTAVPVTTYSGSGLEEDVHSCKGISLENQTRYPYWHEVSIENTSQLQNDLVKAGVTLSQDIDDIMSSIKNSISDSFNPDNNLQVLFNSTNQGKGITFVSNPAFASCCPADVITSPSGASSCLDFTGSETSKPRFFVIYTGNVDRMYCSGNSDEPKLRRACESRTSTRYTYAIIIKAWFTVATDGTVTDFIDATQPGCVVDIICTSRESERSCGSGGNSKCAGVSCVSEYDNEYSIDRISEIKVSNTTGAGSCRKLILTKIQYLDGACSSAGTKSFRIDINETTNWYSSSQQYASIEQQLYEFFWYPLFCSDCDGSVTACTTGDCLNLCFGNGSPYSSSITSSNVQCTMQPSVNRIIIIEKTISGTDTTILTPRIYGPGTSGIEEKTNESVYYVLGQPTDPLDVNTLYRDSCDNPMNIYTYFNLPRILSGTPVQIQSDLLETNEFTVYYTNGEEKEFYEWSAYPCDGGVGDTRNSPVRIVKKYKESTSFLPGIDFNCKIIANGDEFNCDITTVCSENNPSCIDVEFDQDIQGYVIKNTKWKIVAMQSNVWYEYKDDDGNTQIVNYTDNVTTFGPDYISSIYDMYSDPILNKNNFPTTGYSTPGKINMFITVRAHLYYPPVGHRLVEKTKVISIDRNTLRLSLTSSRSRNTKYKLITDEETGKSQCVLMDCSVTTDCNTLPDC